jgi:hypothetical protein
MSLKDGLKSGTLRVGSLVTDVGSVVSLLETSETISAGEIEAGAVGASELGTSAVIAAKIGSGAVTTDKLGSAQVLAANIGAAAITAANIGSNVITSDRIAAATIAAEDIGSNVITADRIAAQAIGTDEQGIVAIGSPLVYGNICMVGSVAPGATGSAWAVFGDTFLGIPHVIPGNGSISAVTTGSVLIGATTAAVVDYIAVGSK